ncbi:hypothetical protein KVR01_003283 [Diaporthe batatas]|uniref:uncharacterized protein n=1 Tax=Diaporthe batatas TaxID=748121 RepID=UPI001D03888E|nr:uncharacterized protein KVR01_003283 [Diaporthe batatas]KAG8167594.1 hypothetical protein KVR01_003283 [Diaporthe batatas]
MASNASGLFGGFVNQQGSNDPNRRTIWRADLESIRRETPVLDATRYRPQQVTIQAQNAPQAPVASSNTGQTSVTSAAQSSQPPAVTIEIIDSDDDDDGGHGAGNVTGAGVLAFYGQQGQEPARAAAMIKYQDQDLARRGKYPSRQNGLGFDMDQLRRDNNWAVPSDGEVAAAWDRNMYMSSPPLGLDEAVTRNWAGDAYDLLCGFPLVEEVVFFRPGNYAGASSACFFKALAYLLYGDHALNLRVQAEHLRYYGDVLEWVNHPRHQLYKRMNRKFYDTSVTANRTDVDLVANFFQLLSIPQAWVPLDLLDVTADLYNLFIVVYTIRVRAGVPPEVTEVSTKGSYNARHICLLFNGYHYQPMVPNDFLASEFTFPRITYENIKSLPSSRVTDGGKASIDLRWRNTWGRGLDRKQGALPVDHAFYTHTLATIMKGSYPRR